MPRSRGKARTAAAGRWACTADCGPAPDVAIRPIESADESFLWDMLYEAIHVPEGEPAPPRDIVQLPELARYVRDWGRAGDYGFIAIDGASGRACGAAWLRLLIGDDRGYGYVDERTPELAIAVLPECRGRGVGTRLLDRLLRSERCETPVCLSVSSDNPAMRLYERFGFRVVDGAGDSVTMLREGDT